MQLEDYFDFLGPDIIRIKGHRINLEHVVRYYNEGYSPEQIAQEYPGLNLEVIYATIAYYLHNKAEVDAMIARQQERTAQMMREMDARPPAPVVERLRALKAQQLQEQSA